MLIELLFAAHSNAWLHPAAIGHTESQAAIWRAVAARALSSFLMIHRRRSADLLL
jgi:hypothetical protein